MKYINLLFTPFILAAIITFVCWQIGQAAWELEAMRQRKNGKEASPLKSKEYYESIKK